MGTPKVALSLYVSPIYGFHSDVIKLLSQNSEVLRILIYTRLKISKKINLCTSSSLVASFIAKIKQFEIPSFHSARHHNGNAASFKNVSPLDLQQYNHFKYLKICLCARMLVLE